MQPAGPTQDGGQKPTDGGPLPLLVYATLIFLLLSLSRLMMKPFLPVPSH